MTEREELILVLKCCMESLTECVGPRCPYFDKHIICPTALKKNSIHFLEEEEEQPQWIPVEDRLPDKDGRYLVCDGGDVLEACFSPTGQLRRNQNGGFDRLPSWSTTDCYESEDLNHVMHWAPLPEPPEMKRV